MSTPRQKPRIPGVSHVAGPANTRPMLTPTEKRILDIEAEHPRHSHPKADLVRAELGLSPARYYQTLVALADTVDARAYDPLTVARVQRLRAAGRRSRAA